MNAFWGGFVARWTFVAMLLSAGFPMQDAFSQGASKADEPAPPWELSRRNPGEPRWATLLRIRELESDYRDSRWWSGYLQILAQEEAAAGNHAAALHAWDSITTPHDSIGVLPAGVHGVGAIDYLTAVADTARVIMVNERHHAGSDRLLTLELLPILWEKGFRYFAAETFTYRDAELNERAYPVEQTGVYTREPVFAAVVREALRLGYVVVPYESTKEQNAVEDDLTPQQRRDLAQAQNLHRAIFEADSTAKVLIHAGYSHILEREDARWHPMALYLRELTGIDPVTVDQTVLSERSDEAYEAPAYRASIAAGLLDRRPTILLDSDNQVYLPADLAVDIQVLTPRTTYTNGRADWMYLGGRREKLAVDVPECSERWCFVEARVAGEPPEAIALDWTEVKEGNRAWLFVPPNEDVVVHVFSETGELLRARKIVAGEPALKDRSGGRR